MQSVIYAECHLCGVSFMLGVIFANCHLCLVLPKALMLTVVILNVVILFVVAPNLPLNQTLYNDFI